MVLPKKIEYIMTEMEKTPTWIDAYGTEYSAD